MGRLVEGKWTTQSVIPRKGGRFKRGETTFRDWIRADGSTDYAPAKGRYHLYVSYACPWAHRTLITRALKKLEDVVSLSVVHPFVADDGWTFDEGPGVVPDPIGGARYLWEVFVRAQSDYTGRVRVPVLWDREKDTIVSNESREIVRMFDCELGELADTSIDLYPEDRREEIEETIDAIFAPVNNGVYRAGFAGNQEAYDEAVTEVFEMLDRLEARLRDRRFLCGDRLTEADVCLFPTLARFDLVYHTHFKCNVKRIVDYPALWGYSREIYQLPGVAGTCDFEHIAGHYYRSHESVNPKRIVPRGPDLDWNAPPDRDHLPRA